MDREKVIKGLNHCFHGQECCGDTECPYYIEHLSDSCCLEDCQENLKVDALALLKEHESKNVVNMTLSKNYSLIASCPKCNMLLTRVEHKNYCGYCGQAVKWE